ncbi:molybdopterin-dependent oxidoreductase [Rhodococcoides fascians]|uniref:molybdopterin-dependent oxidoreductase n=1 Tax=Rhodococcoides fascians TaxID=1828 RepID=UPI00050BEB84|nr:molybdopterin-dependent oxidoreductase [Rhodococcus fascians]
MQRLPTFRSPIRGVWFTSVLASVLLVALPIVTVTGLISWVAYGPQFGQSMPGDVGWLRLPSFDWPTEPVWFYRLTQGLHVGLGLIMVPIVLAKLWSVIPKLIEMPPIRSIAHLLERISLLALVGGILFEIITGVLNIQYDYLFGFSFYTAHYWGAWVFIAGFLAHVVLKFPTMVTALRTRPLLELMRIRVADTVPDADDESGLATTDPAPATISRRGALTLVGGSALFVAVLSAGQTTGGFLRDAAILLPRGRSYGNGPNDFQINRTAQAAGIDEARTGDSWRLTVRAGATEVVLTRAQLEQMDLHTVDLPIACVEGWSTVQTWTGVRLRDLAAIAGIDSVDTGEVRSLEPSGSFNRVTFGGHQMMHPDSLLALRVNGENLSLDHGYPARIMMPAIPGVHATKWIESVEFFGENA